jgi:hypothetical protein
MAAQDVIANCHRIAKTMDGAKLGYPGLDLVGNQPPVLVFQCVGTARHKHLLQLNKPAVLVKSHFKQMDWSLLCQHWPRITCREHGRCK